MKILSLIIFIALFFFHPAKLFALGEPNNKFGIHLAVADEKSLKDAADLANSSGGDWGYVTLVIQENDFNLDKWQDIFDKMRTLHLIPLIRLAGTPQANGFWGKPKKEDAEKWAVFLNSLHWVVKNRYIILFNEPNHNKEWGGEINPKEYGEIAFAFAKKLKETDDDFFIMLAGFDAAAPNRLPLYENEEIFLKKMFEDNKDNFNFIDGWTSHSYPNHGFIGLPTDTGRNSIKTYLWELALLKSLGVDKELPVFITETGWPHNQNQSRNFGTKCKNYLSPEKAAENIKIAFEEVWLKDENISAVTPFILNYEAAPFDCFSWKIPNSGDFYPQYELAKNIPKIKGEPGQTLEETFNFSSEFFFYLPYLLSP